MLWALFVLVIFEFIFGCSLPVWRSSYLCFPAWLRMIDAHHCTQSLVEMGSQWLFASTVLELHSSQSPPGLSHLSSEWLSKLIWYFLIYVPMFRFFVCKMGNRDCFLLLVLFKQ
jgi:hypothetical protein